MCSRYALERSARGGRIRPRLDLGRLALWQPYQSGRLAISQFLRLRAVGTVVGTAPRESTDLRQTMRESGYLEVAGYDVNNDLVAEFETLQFASVLSINWQEVRVLSWLRTQSNRSPSLRRCFSRRQQRAVSGRKEGCGWGAVLATPEIRFRSTFSRVRRNFSHE